LAIRQRTYMVIII